LRLCGPKALAFADVEGIEDVTLYELVHSWDRWSNEKVARSADDVFTVLGQRGKGINSLATLKRATFHVKLRGVRFPRTVTIRGTNLAEYVRDEHSATIERWLVARGFARDVESTRAAA
jgi:hypothetical protein